MPSDDTIRRKNNFFNMFRFFRSPAIKNKLIGLKKPRNLAILYAFIHLNIYKWEKFHKLSNSLKWFKTLTRAFYSVKDKRRHVERRTIVRVYQEKPR